MSVINKKPLISKVVSNLTAAEKNKLLLGLNGGLSKSVKVFNSLTTTDKDISLLDLKFNDGVKTGYLIYNDSVSVFIAFYSDTQRLSLFNLDITQHTYTSSREYLTIDELRNVVELGLIEQGEHLKVQADDIDSGSATAGYVLTADGEGGATWGEAGGGSDIEDATDIPCELTGGDNIPVIAGDLAENNHLMYADFRHTFFTETIADSKITGASLELCSFAYEKVASDKINYDDGNVICNTSLDEDQFMTLIETCATNMGTTYDLEVYDGFDVSHPIEMVYSLYKIYQYKILKLIYSDGGYMYMELDNKDVEFHTLPFAIDDSHAVAQLVPSVFKGKVHMVNALLGSFDINVVLSFEEDDGYYRFALRLQATPHTEPNQFLAPEYDTTVSYVAGDLCLHLGVLYVCTANTSGTFDDSDWQPTTIAGSVLGLLNTGV